MGFWLDAYPLIAECENEEIENILWIFLIKSCLFIIMLKAPCQAFFNQANRTFGVRITKER